MTSLKHFIEERIAHDSSHSDTILIPPQTVPCGPLDCGPLPCGPLDCGPLPCGPLDCPSSSSVVHPTPPPCNLSPHLACGQATPSALVPPSVSLVPPSVSLVDVTHHQCASDQSMTSPRREWATTGLSRDKHPSISLSQYSFVNVPSSPNARVVPTTTNQRLLLDTPSTSNQIVMADAPTTTHPRALRVSPTQNRRYDADCKRYDGVEGLPPRAMQGVPSLSLSSPLLFDSAPSICSSPIPMSQKAPHPAPSVCQRYPQPVASTVKFSTETLDSSDDSDVTPPISPHGSPEVMHQLLVVDHTKTSTSSHLKRNVRVARTKSCAESGVNVECEQQPKFPLLYAHVRCLCRGSLCQDKVLVQTTDLKPYLAGCGVTHASSSNLLSHFGNLTAANIHVADYSQMTCSLKEALQLNAIWDSVLHLCYGLLECPHCKRDVGIVMHMARDCDSLAGKAFMDCRSVELLSQSEKDHGILY
eukprot:Em0015g116a